MAPCNRHRGELDARLRECGYGSDAAMFACFFRRDDNGADSKHAGAILCSSCGHSIGDHRDGPAAAGERAGTGADDVVIGTAVNPAGEAVAIDMRPVRNTDDVPAAPFEQPPLPPGVVAKSHHDELYFDPPGWGWRVGFYGGLVCLLLICPASIGLMIVGINSEDGGFAEFFVGQLLMAFSLSLGITGLAIAPASRIHTLRFGRVLPRGNAAAYLARTIMHDSTSACCKSVCSCDELDFKQLTAKDVKSVQLHYSTTDNPQVSETNVALQFFADHLHVPVFEGKTADPHAVAQAWRVYLRPDAPDRLGHVEESGQGAV